MINSVAPSGVSSTALLIPAWWEWNERVWGVEAREFKYSTPGGAGADLVGAMFLGRHARIATPPLMPHLPIGLVYGGNAKREASDRGGYWLPLADRLAEDLVLSGFANDVVLPAGFVDGRPFSWAGLRVGISYTFVASLPHDLAKASRAVRKNVRKSAERGYRVGRSDDWAGIFACLQETEGAKGFRHGLRERDLLLGAKLLGLDSFRGYAVHDAHGRVVSGGIRLHLPGHQAVDWVQGTTRSALTDGVNQLMYDFVMTDLYEAGAHSFDLAGANIRDVAAAKASWGYPLTPQLRIEQGGVAREMKRSLAGVRSVMAVRNASLDARSALHDQARKGREALRARS